MSMPPWSRPRSRRSTSRPLLVTQKALSRDEKRCYLPCDRPSRRLGLPVTRERGASPSRFASNIRVRLCGRATAAGSWRSSVAAMTARTWLHGRPAVVAGGQVMARILTAQAGPTPRISINCEPGAALSELQALLDTVIACYNITRPHCSLPGRGRGAAGAPAWRAGRGGLRRLPRDDRRGAACSPPRWQTGNLR